MGNPVFTNEAARDAAISSPVEGQRCYLTAPTVPAATGATTAVPTGVTTIYNGSVWVCVTPVSAFTSTSGTTSSTSYTATLSSGGTNPSVTLVTGTTALVHLRYRGSPPPAGAQAYCSVAVSGAGTVAASDDNGLFTNTGLLGHGHSFVLTGLTAGTNTFTIQYRVTGNSTAFEMRGIIVEGIA